VAERPVRRTAAGLVACLVVASLLTGCSNSTSSYCSSLKDEQKQLTRLSKKAAEPGKAGSAALDGTVSVLADLRDEAPEDIADEWDTLVSALQALAQAVKDSGAPPSAFASGTRPAGVTAGQYEAVQQAATELQGTRVQQAGSSIEQHGRDVCKVDLGSGLGGIG
jgi:hypothetical protein